MTTPPLPIYAPDSLRGWVLDVFRALGLEDADAAIVADGLIEADLRGVESHGVSRIPIYAERLRRNLIKARPDIRIAHPAPVAAHVDGDHGIGFVVARRAMGEAVRLAEESGIGLVGVTNSNHFGMAALYLEQAIDAGFLAFAFTNSSPALPVWGGRTAFLGTAPFAAGAPGGEQGPFIVDMAMSVIARGKIRLAALYGEPLPEGVALDADGQPTRDAQKGYEGVYLPFGGHKGAALAMLIDILSGVLTGAGYAGGVRNQSRDFTGPTEVGHFFLAIRADLFMPMEEYRARMDTLIERARSCPTADGFEEILIPGEPEQRQREERLRTGIPISASILEDLKREAETLGVAMPDPLPAAAGPTR